MFVLGLQGSPRKAGNTATMLYWFLDMAKELGAVTLQLQVPDLKIQPCKECGTCETKGFCPIEDQMQEVYPLLWKADLVVIGTPIFFYGPTAQLKALIDRSQALWSRKYIFNLDDPGRPWRKGLLLAVGATKGKNLFEGTKLTAKYFFDAFGAYYQGALTYSRIESAGQIKEHPTAFEDIRKKAEEMIRPFLSRKRVLFQCRENACRSQMSAAFARFLFGDKMEVESAGSNPAPEVNPMMKEAMAEKGIDMSYLAPKSLEQVSMKPQVVVSMGCEDNCTLYPGAKLVQWDIPDPSGKDLDFMKRVRDQLVEKIKQLAKEVESKVMK